MLKPSDFNNAVPQFQNGNYASNPINPQYVEEPSSTDYNRGTEPLQTLPAQWWNWFINKFTSRFNKVNIYVKNLFNELAQLLSLVNVTPDGTESSVTDGQLKNAFKELYPAYINDKLELGTTYVKKTQKVNNHALTGDVTVTKSDVGLGSVANTGDSANASSGGTTKFTTGGAYNLLSSIAPYFSTSTTYAVGALITYQNRLYECTTAHSAGAWNANHFTARSVQYVLDTLLAKKADLLDLAPAFSTSTSYAVGDYVTYNGNLYSCTVAHSGAWNASHFTLVTVGGELAKKTDITTFEDATDVTTHFDNAPYTSRVTDYDRASTDSIIGASFAVNQLVKNGNFASTSNWDIDTGRATFSVSNGIGKMNNFLASSPFIKQDRTFENGHKYLVSIEVLCNQPSARIGFVLRSDWEIVSQKYRAMPTSSRQLVSNVLMANDTTNRYTIMFQKNDYNSSTEVTFSNANLIDLTQMFGSDIADRIYAMEQATAGSGIAWIKSFGFFNNDYYATDEGSIQNVKPSAHKVSTSVVKWFTNRNTSSQYSVCLYAEAILKPNTNYTLYFRGANGASIYTNENIFTTIGAATLDGSLQSMTIKTKTDLPYANATRFDNGWGIFKNAQGNTVVPNFTEFYIVEEGVNANPSFSQSIPLADTELRGIPKLDSNNNLYYDGDIYYPNGDVIRRYGVVDLGSLTWARDTVTEGTATGRFLSSGISANAIPKSINSIMTNGFSAKNAQSAMQDKCYRIDNSENLVITDTAYTDATAFKTAMNGVYLIYELATPTKETVAGYSNPHTLIRKGAEEFVDNRTIPLPVGHETTYLSLPDWLSESDPFAIGIDSGIYTELAKKVDKTTTVNGHALSGNVTVTKGDVGLGSVENTGDSAVPAENGITKFTTGGAYNLLTSLAPIFNTSTSYAVGDMVTYNGRLYTCTTTHSGAWNASHFTVANLNTEFQKPADNVVQRYDSSHTYEKDELVIYNNKLYKCTQTTYVAGDFDPTKFTNVSMYPSKNEIKTCISRYVFNYSLNGISASGNLPALSAGSECVLRLDNDSDSSATIEFEALHAYSLGVIYSNGGVSTVQKLTQGQDFSVTVPARSYLEVTLNYLEVDGDSIANYTMFTYPIPTIRHR